MLFLPDRKSKRLHDELVEVEGFVNSNIRYFNFSILLPACHFVTIFEDVFNLSILTLKSLIMITRY